MQNQRILFTSESVSEGHPDLCYYTKEGKAVVPYMRILIRPKKGENNENNSSN